MPSGGSYQFSGDQAQRCIPLSSICSVHSSHFLSRISLSQHWSCEQGSCKVFVITLNPQAHLTFISGSLRSSLVEALAEGAAAGCSLHLAELPAVVASEAPAP